MLEFIFIYEKREGLGGRYYAVGTREKTFEGFSEGGYEEHI